MSSTLPTLPVAPGWRRWLPMLALAFCVFGAGAQDDAGDPPGRVAAVTQRQGSVVFAPAGDEEWTALPQNRPLTQADRLWTDQGARVELHLGTETVHVRDLTNLGIVELDDRTTHLSITQGSLNARVRELQPGDQFIVGTPNLSARASQPGDFRIDVDPDTASTRVAVRSGTVTVYGQGGRGRIVGPGEDAVFVARDLEQVEPDRRSPDAFDQWVTARNQQEDRSPTAQVIPRDVVGYAQLDNHGVWQQDTTYGPVWYPNTIAADWAPYRQGHWEWIRPWGWTWVDDAPWGFAPFHYGRWAMIGQRWAWVPGRLGPRPVYAPALVTFVGGGNNVSFTVGNSPGIAWYPLGPGEAWHPGYRASTVYVRNVNRHIHVPPRHARPTVYVNSRYPGAITSVRLEDFSRGRPVGGHWHRVDPARVAGATIITAPSRPAWTRTGREYVQPPALVQTPRTVTQPRWNTEGRANVVPRGDTGTRHERWTRPDNDTSTRSGSDTRTHPRWGTDRRANVTPAAPATPPTTPVTPPRAPTTPVTAAPPAPAAPAAPQTTHPNWERDQARILMNSTRQGRIQLEAQDRFFREQREQQQAREQQAQPARQVQPARQQQVQPTPPQQQVPQAPQQQGAPAAQEHSRGQHRGWRQQDGDDGEARGRRGWQQR